MSKKNETGYTLDYDDFEYRGYKERYYMYDVPFDDLMAAIREYFDNQLITLDGTDTSVFNALAELECIDNIFDAMEDWLHDRCKEDAYEEFKEWVDYYFDSDEEIQDFMKDEQ